jgi:hypothetical protein
MLKNSGVYNRQRAPEIQDHISFENRSLSGDLERRNRFAEGGSGMTSTFLTTSRTVHQQEFEKAGLAGRQTDRQTEGQLNRNTCQQTITSQLGSECSVKKSQEMRVLPQGRVRRMLAPLTARTTNALSFLRLVVSICTC